MSLKALTLRHPWAFAVAYLGKNCENRTWDDHLCNLNRVYDLLGQQIAIHGGAAPQQPKRAMPLHKLAESNLWRQHCEDLAAIKYGPMLGQPLPEAARAYLAKVSAGGPLLPEHFICTGIVAVATVQRITRASRSDWAAHGQLHIELSEVIALPSPVGCPGAQGLWTLPEAIEEAVQHELTRWSIGQIPPESGKAAEEWLR